MSRRHPSRSSLQRWFDGPESDEDLELHLDGCDRCASVIEELAAADDPVSSALQTVLAAPPDLRQRLESGISARLQNRQDLSMLVGLMGIGFQTARLMTDAGAAPSDDLGPRPTEEDET